MLIKPEGFTILPDPIEFLFQAKEKGQDVEAQVVALDYPDGAPTWILSFPGLSGVKGLVPASETGLTHKNLMPRFVGQEIRVKVKGVDKENGLAACSRGEAVAEAAGALIPKLAEEPERVWDGVVRAVLPPEGGKPVRLLVDVGGGVLAEVPRREASVWITKPVGAQHPPGSRVKLRITKVDPQTGDIFASIKKALPDPWEKADFKRGQFISATVAYIRNGIVFLEPDACPGILGIASVPIVGEVNRGDRVSCAVASFDRGARKLRLRLRGRLA